jgi:hypothetical protein
VGCAGIPRFEMPGPCKIFKVPPLIGADVVAVVGFVVVDAAVVEEVVVSLEQLVITNNERISAIIAEAIFFSDIFTSLFAILA